MFVERIETTTLPNGVRVVSETVDHVRSVSIGIWVAAGSRDEAPAHRGISHFIEHMLFKGTATRSAREIAETIETRGGSINAFTDREFTCYYARALAEDAPIAIEVLADLICGSLLDPEELEREKNVVLEEIKLHNDSPEDLVHDRFLQTIWGTHALGRSVLGSAASVGGLDRDTLTAHLASHYGASRIVISASGNIGHDETVALANRWLGGLGPGARRATLRAPKVHARTVATRKRTEQVHFCLGGPGYSYNNDDRFGLTLIDLALGGNMSSRLFQEIREKRGLAYAIGSYSSSFREAGCFTIYGGTSPATFSQVIDLTRAEMRRLRDENLTEAEVAGAKKQMRGSLVLGLEGMTNRMMRMGKSLLTQDCVVPLEEILGKIDAVTLDDTSRIARTVLDESTLAMVAIGPSPRARTSASEEESDD